MTHFFVHSLQAGYDVFEFPHKSIQEYLTAEFIVKLPTIPFQKKMLSFPSEFAISVAISSKPSLYLIQLMFDKFKNLPLTKGFLESFLDRISLEKPDFQPDPLLALSILYLDTFRLVLDISIDIFHYMRLSMNPYIFNTSFKLLGQYYSITRVVVM